MELRVLRYFLAVAQEESISAAAEYLHLTQPTLSRQLMDLENVVATYSLLYNASLMVQEGLGLALGLDKLINTTGDSRLCFRPLDPRLELDLYIVWKKYQVFSRASEKFLQQLKSDLEA